MEVEDTKFFPWAEAGGAGAENTKRRPVPCTGNLSASWNTRRVRHLIVMMRKTIVSCLVEGVFRKSCWLGGGGPRLFIHQGLGLEVVASADWERYGLVGGALGLKRPDSTVVPWKTWAFRTGPVFSNDDNGTLMCH